MRGRQGDPLEYVNWKDAGCDLYPSCLSCPLPQCIEEQPRGRQRQRMYERSSGMMALRDRGLAAREIAAVYRVSVRTVQRALRRKIPNAKNQIPNN